MSDDAPHWSLEAWMAKNKEIAGPVSSMAEQMAKQIRRIAELEEQLQAARTLAQRPESREVAEQLVTCMWSRSDIPSMEDWSKLITQALDNAWKGGMERAAEIVDAYPTATASPAALCVLDGAAFAIREAKEQSR